MALRLIDFKLGEEIEESASDALSLHLLFRLFIVERITMKRARHTGFWKNKIKQCSRG
jgi:hypothetical protein